MVDQLVDSEDDASKLPDSRLDALEAEVVVKVDAAFETDAERLSLRAVILGQSRVPC